MCFNPRVVTIVVVIIHKEDSATPTSASRAAGKFNDRTVKGVPQGPTFNLG